jgi:hypothetical protein
MSCHSKRVVAWLALPLPYFPNRHRGLLCTVLKSRAAQHPLMMMRTVSCRSAAARKQQHQQQQGDAAS